jgi:RND family efflux transporter MFP subunit
VRAAPAAERTLATRAGGRVLATHVTDGQTVRAGDALLSLDPAPLRGAVAQSRAALAQAVDALAEYDRTGRTRQQLELDAAVQRATSQQALLDAQVARLESLHGEGLSSDRALAESKQAASQARADKELAAAAVASFHDVSAELQHSTLLAARDGAQAAADEAERQLAEAEPTAPADGQVISFRARAGQLLQPGEAFGELLASEGRLVAFAVTAAAARELRPGARATWLDAQGHPAAGALQSVGGDVDAATGMVLALVAPDAAADADRPGLAVRGELELLRLHDAVLVPDAAVLRAHDAQVVVLAVGDRARTVPVTVAGRHGGLVAVQGDVHAGDRVLIDGGYNLPDGARIVASSAAHP